MTVCFVCLFLNETKYCSLGPSSSAYLFVNIYIPNNTTLFIPQYASTFWLLGESVDVEVQTPIMYASTVTFGSRLFSNGEKITPCFIELHPIIICFIDDSHERCFYAADYLLFLKLIYLY